MYTTPYLDNFWEGFEKSALWKELVTAGSLLTGAASHAGGGNAARAALKSFTSPQSRQAASTTLRKMRSKGTAPSFLSKRIGGTAKASGKKTEAVSAKKMMNVSTQPGVKVMKPAPKESVGKKIDKGISGYRGMEKQHGFKIRPSGVEKSIPHGKLSLSRLGEAGAKYKNLALGYGKGGASGSVTHKGYRVAANKKGVSDISKTFGLGGGSASVGYKPQSKGVSVGWTKSF